MRRKRGGCKFRAPSLCKPALCQDLSNGRR